MSHRTHRPAIDWSIVALGGFCFVVFGFAALGIADAVLWARQVIAAQLN